MIEIPVAVQMFTLRKESQEDSAGTLKKVAELGYHGALDLSVISIKHC
ncbi:hypothetical protein SAMN05443253_104247 [Bacillus sp. OK048]|nr:hypothetical protein SAMN05443253_104247 [Bacillus sp. OK048]